MRNENPTCVALSVLLIVCGTFAADGPSSITKLQLTQARKDLADYESGKLTLHELTDDKKRARTLIGFYWGNTNEITAKMKLPISRCFAGFSKYQDAARLAQEYVSVYSNDWRGWSMLGGVKYLMNSYNEAIWAYTNAVNLGDEGNLTGLGGAALAVGRLDVLSAQVVPRLLVLKDKSETSDDDRLEMVGVLVGYSLQAEQKDVFVKALIGLSAVQLNSRADIRSIVEKGCQRFKAKETEKLCSELAEVRGTEPDADRKAKDP
jgi:hypothetical protein